jgi:RNA polymerase sigma-70 factor (ECF subfamily)
VDVTAGSTSTTLVRQVLRGEAQAWDRFAHLYVPLVHRWARQMGLQSSDANDVCQNVFVSVLRSLKTFRSGQPGQSLRGWLRTITRNAAIDLHRQRARQVPPLDDASPQWTNIAPEPSEADDLSPSERALLVARAAEIVQREVDATTWEMFWQLSVEQRAAKEIAAANALTVWAVYKARMRVLARFDELLSDSLEPP